MLAHLPKDLRQLQDGIAPPVTDMRGFPPRTHTPRSTAGTPPAAIIAELQEPRKHQHFSKIAAQKSIARLWSGCGGFHRSTFDIIQRNEGEGRTARCGIAEERNQEVLRHCRAVEGHRLPRRGRARL